MSTGTAPTVPVEYQQYNSYVIDPIWQKNFSIIWASILGFTVLISLPYLVKSVRNGRAFVGTFGLHEEMRRSSYTDRPTRKASKPASSGISSIIRSIFLWSAPGIGLNLGQFLVIVVYFAVILVCIIKDAPLVSNPNRAGFMALAQLPPVFLFASKNSILTPFLGSYENLNFIHRWSARGLFLGAVIHGALWIRNHLVWNIPIIGQQKETSGVAALGVLCVIVLSSLRPVRKFGYEIFFLLHLLAFPAFFITICYHTIYAAPWIFPPLAFYGFDVVMRLLRYRIKDAALIPVDNQMTLIHIPHSTSGWIAGQHIRLRILSLGSRVFESHPLTVLSAPAEISCIASEGEIILGARVKGDWTKALNSYATYYSEQSEKKAPSAVPTHVLIDGPYGSTSSVDLGRYETVLLVAGGSGVTFTIGMLDDIVGRCVRQQRRNGERTKRIEFVWCIRGFGNIHWFAPFLQKIANVAAQPESGLDLHFSINVTCLCNPDAVPVIPNSDIAVGGRPSIRKVIEDLFTPLSDDEETELKVGSKGGLGVCASGPESMIRQAGNDVAKANMSMGRLVGGIDLYTEVFSI